MELTLTARTIHMSAFDPDFRRQPKTDDHCWRCQKDLKPGQPRRYLHFVEGGQMVAHPSCEQEFNNTPGDVGCFPVGADCARTMRKLTGEEWTFEMAPLSKSEAA